MTVADFKDEVYFKWGRVVTPLIQQTRKERKTLSQGVNSASLRKNSTSRSEFRVAD